jgi:hypothetical protein
MAESTWQISSTTAMLKVYAELGEHLRKVLAAVDHMRRVTQEGMLSRLLTPEETDQLARIGAIRVVPVDPTLDPHDPGPGGRWTGIEVLPFGLRLMTTAIHEFVPGRPESGYLDVDELTVGRGIRYQYRSNVVRREVGP